MLIILAAIVAFLCLGPSSLTPDLPTGQLTAPPLPGLARAPAAVPEVAVCPPPAADRTPKPPPALAVQGPGAGRFDPKLRSRLDHLIRKYAHRHDVDEKLVRAVLRQESGGNPLAVSPKGAQGLMQLMPATAECMGVKDAFDPEDNLAGGVKYLKHCLVRFQKDVALALAAYNAGPEAVEKYGGVPPYGETENYVTRVMAAYHGKSWINLRQVRLSPPAGPAQKEASTPRGLDWRVPSPSWKIASPRGNLPTPRWKAEAGKLSGIPGAFASGPESLGPAGNPQTRPGTRLSRRSGPAAALP